MTAVPPGGAVPSAGVTHVLVTGAAGRLGRAVLALLGAHGVRATGLDRQPADGVPVDRMLVGDVTDPATVGAALDGVDGVIHLAAIPAPMLGTPEQVFGGNALGTFVVLEAAGRAGIRRAVFASSLSVLGLAFPPVPLAPAYLPIDADHPLQVADPYALSKQADEATGAMMARRYGMSVVGLRYPLLGGPGDRLPAIAASYRDDSRRGAGSLWAYLDDRDAAAAAWLALTVAPGGYRLFHVAAPLTLAPQPTEELLAAHFPAVPRRRVFPGRTVPVDVEPIAAALGFRPVHEYVPVPL